MILPVGIDNFERIRQDGYYYVDKTGFISELLRKSFGVNLITRPRRFGKSLNISTLSSFFDIAKDSKKLFAGLEIAKEGELCATWMNQWPVLSLTLKNVEGLTFEYAYSQLQSVISDCCFRLEFLLQSEKVNFDRELFQRLAAKRGTPEEVSNSVFTLSRMLFSYFNKPVIILIDEYDVPLAKASEHGYYPQMMEVIRGLLGKALKSNDFLKFAVVSGCLRIAKESIFTGINNLVTDTISGERFSEYLGFTQKEVLKLLVDAGLPDHSDEMKEWYNGYHFGKTDIYCPWDVLNHVNRLQDQPDAKPENYWKNTSHNGIIRSFLGRTDLMVNEKFEILLSGGFIREKITEDLTYDVLHSSEENLWTILYLTGYLTQNGFQDGLLKLQIPNKEIKSIFTETVMEWFKEDVVTSQERQELLNALWEENAKKATSMLSDLLFETISYHDYDESYYHAFLAGIFSGSGFAVTSNYEFGLGRPDIVVADKRNRRAMIIEVKHAKDEKGLQAGCGKALDQIHERQYAKGLEKGYRKVICYGISFFEKECRVMI